MSFTIKDFNTNKEFGDLDAVADCLRKDFRNASISIQWKTEGGVIQSRFISILKDGSLIDTYTEEKVDLVELCG